MFMALLGLCVTFTERMRVTAAKTTVLVHSRLTLGLELSLANRPKQMPPLSVDRLVLVLGIMDLDPCSNTNTNTATEFLRALA